MSAFLELLKERVREERKYFEDPERYLKVLKEILKKELGDDVRVFLFGSVVRGDYVVGKSDIDVLVVSKNVPQRVYRRSELVTEFLRAIVDLYAPFEIHFATPEQFEGWYKRFIKEDIREVQV